jgi:hypothetical protein
MGGFKEWVGRFDTYKGGVQVYEAYEVTVYVHGGYQDLPGRDRVWHLQDSLLFNYCRAGGSTNLSYYFCQRPGTPGLSQCHGHGDPVVFLKTTGSVLVLSFFPKYVLSLIQKLKKYFIYL